MAREDGAGGGTDKGVGRVHLHTRDVGGGGGLGGLCQLQPQAHHTPDTDSSTTKASGRAQAADRCASALRVPLSQQTVLSPPLVFPLSLPKCRGCVCAYMNFSMKYSMVEAILGASRVRKMKSVFLLKSALVNTVSYDQQHNNTARLRHYAGRRSPRVGQEGRRCERGGGDVLSRKGGC